MGCGFLSFFFFLVCDFSFFGVPFEMRKEIQNSEVTGHQAHTVSGVQFSSPFFALARTYWMLSIKWVQDTLWLASHTGECECGVCNPHKQNTGILYSINNSCIKMAIWSDINALTVDSIFSFSFLIPSCLLFALMCGSLQSVSSSCFLGGISNLKRGVHWGWV